MRIPNSVWGAVLSVGVLTLAGSTMVAASPQPKADAPGQAALQVDVVPKPEVRLMLLAPRTGPLTVQPCAGLQLPLQAWR